MFYIYFKNFRIFKVITVKETASSRVGMTVHQLTILHKVKKKYIRESSEIWDIGQKIEGKWLYSLGNIVKKDEMHNIKVV